MYLGTESETVEENETFQTFIERSQKLCRAWEVTLLLMTKFLLNNKNENDAVANFNKRVKLGMKTIFNESVYEGFIKDTNYSLMESSVTVSKFFFNYLICFLFCNHLSLKLKPGLKKIIGLLVIFTSFIFVAVTNTILIFFF